ncbi:MAG: STAS domain-containing protein [Acidimicrobiia bacterium]
MNAAVEQGILRLTGELDVDERREFTTQTQSAIEHGDPVVRLNCSTVDVSAPVNDGVVGMLVSLTRTAQHRGARIELVRAPKRMRAQLEAVGVAHLFEWRG